MKRKTAFILALIMILAAVLSACGKTQKPEEKTPVTPDSLIGSYRKKAEQQTGVSYRILMDMSMGVTILVQAVDLDVSGDINVESTPDAGHIYGSLTTNAGGEKETEKLESYSIKENGAYTIYSYSDGEWTKSTSPVSMKTDIQGILAMQDTAGMELSETDTEYLVKGTVSLAELIDAVKDYVGGLGELGDSIDLSTLDFSGVAPANTVYHFDKTTQEVTGVDIDMTECAQSIMDQIVKIAAGLLASQDDSMAGLDLSSLIKVKANKLTISLTDISFDKTINIVVPEDAKNASEAPKDLGGDAPEGYAMFETEELNILLPSVFVEAEIEAYTGAFTDNISVVLILREGKELFANYADNINEYIALVLKANEGRGLSELMYENGRPCFEYTADGGNGDTYKYYTSVYESEDAYWLVQFACMSNIYDTLRPSYAQMADTVTFD